MTVEALVELLYEVDKDYQVVFSNTHVINEKEELVAILDTPIIGIVKNEGDNEVRFLISSDTLTDEELINMYGEENIKFINKDSE